MSTRLGWDREGEGRVMKGVAVRDMEDSQGSWSSC